MLADLAHHFAAAAPIDGPRGRSSYNLLAAQAASAALCLRRGRRPPAHGSASWGSQDERHRAEILLDAGHGAVPGRALARLAAVLPRRRPRSRAELDEGELLARAAIGFETSCWRPGLTDQGARELLEEASAALAREDSTLRVGLLASLARALEFEGNSERAAITRAERDRDGTPDRRPARAGDGARGRLLGARRRSKRLDGGPRDA